MTITHLQDSRQIVTARRTDDDSKQWYGKGAARRCNNAVAVLRSPTIVSLVQGAIPQMYSDVI